MARLEPWQELERDIQDAWGLSATLNSGNKFWDSGDAVENRPDIPFAMWVDTKHCTQKSYSLRASDMVSFKDRAAHLGKRFALVVRFVHPVRPRSVHMTESDFVVLAREDYEELLNMAGVIDG